MKHVCRRGEVLPKSPVDVHLHNFLSPSGTVAGCGYPPQHCSGERLPSSAPASGDASCNSTAHREGGPGCRRGRERRSKSEPRGGRSAAKGVAAALPAAPRRHSERAGSGDCSPAPPSPPHPPPPPALPLPTPPGEWRRGGGGRGAAGGGRPKLAVNSKKADIQQYQSRWSNHSSWHTS